MKRRKHGVTENTEKEDVGTKKESLLAKFIQRVRVRSLNQLSQFLVSLFDPSSYRIVLVPPY
jgi:hypothetical protein